ncbi:MAG: ribulose-bisphosphate carboxylase large subunit [Candidatus Paceibacterota bacterium]|jgi:ribulose-bisphosphate carboxylase large chain
MAVNSYLKLGQKPDKTDIVSVLKVVPAKGIILKECAQEIAGESSVGTWTDITTLDKKTFDKLAAKVIYINEKTEIVKIAYPIKLFEKGNISQLWSTIAGNIFSMKKIKDLKILDITFPDTYVNTYLGPQFGIEGVRKAYGIKNRPIVGCIIKPKVGLSAKETGKLAYDVFVNGADFIKDDETLTDMEFCPFEDRIREIVKAMKKAEKITGKKKIFAFNISAPTDEMKKRARFVKKTGGKCIMIDVFTCGLSAVQDIRSDRYGLIIHGHRAGHSAFTDDVSMLAYSKFCRLAGIDELHTGTVVGKMEGTKKEVIEINKFLTGKWGKIKPVMPVASGGLHPGLSFQLVKILGKNLIVNFGGGIHGHPDGSGAGAKAALQSIEAASKGISLNTYARKHEELKKALKHFKK